LGTPGGIGTRFMMFPLVWNAQKKKFFCLITSVPTYKTKSYKKKFFGNDVTPY
jgi:hypothetical protein